MQSPACGRHFCPHWKWSTSSEDITLALVYPSTSVYVQNIFFFGIGTAGSFLQQLARIFLSKCSLYRKAGFTITSHTSTQFTSITFFLTLSNPPPLLPFLHPHLQERSPHFSYDTPCPWDFSSWRWLILLCVMIRTCRKETRRITPFKHAWRNGQGTYDLYSGD